MRWPNGFIWIRWTMCVESLNTFLKYAPMVPLFRSSPKRITKWSKCMICGFGYFWLNSTPWNTPQAFHELISSLWFHSWKSIPWIGEVESPHGLMRREKQPNMLTLYGNQRFEDGILWWTVSTKIALTIQNHLASRDRNPRPFLEHGPCIVIYVLKHKRKTWWCSIAIMLLKYRRVAISHHCQRSLTICQVA